MLRIYKPEEARQTLLRRDSPDKQTIPFSLSAGIESIFGEPITPEEAVQRILRDVRQRGDVGLADWSARLDGQPEGGFRVPEKKINAALESLDGGLITALRESARRVEAFHQHQPLTSWITSELGGTLGQLVRPIQRVGLYIPGGTAPLPSTVIMSAIPAKVAGVKEIVVASPASRLTGEIAPAILAACAIAGVDEIYAVGGAQAIAALAYGTETIRAVHKIVGPGNIFVTLAKRLVYGVVGIDGLAGPTETMIIADKHAQPGWVAADLLAQAEHDVMASAILITTSEPLAKAVQMELGHKIETLPRAEIIITAFENRGGVILVHDLDEAADLANLYGPEHLCLAVENPWSLLEKIQNAGGVFIGEHSFEVLGDYNAGPSHVMPTGGTARFASPLNVWDFVHLISLVALDANTTYNIAGQAATLAKAESLNAHAHAAEIRLTT